LSNIQKVEIVKPYRQRELPIEILLDFIAIGIRTLFVWWTVAAWFPELGITYWETILPVYALRMMFNNPSYKGRVILWKNVVRDRWATYDGKRVYEDVNEDVTSK
jgi:hypothetical protein